MVPGNLRRQLRSGLSARAVQSRRMVSPQSCGGPDGAAGADPGDCVRPATLRLPAHLGVAAPGGLADQPQARASPLSASKGCSYACAYAGTSTRHCSVAQHRRRWGRASGGAWTSSTTRSTMAGPFRVLTVVDQWSRQSRLLMVGTGISGQRVGEALAFVLLGGPAPRSITVDHGTEFQSRALEDWAYRRGVQLDFTRPGNLRKTHSSSRSMVGCGTSA